MEHSSKQDYLFILVATVLSFTLWYFFKKGNYSINTSINTVILFVL